MCSLEDDGGEYTGGRGGALLHQMLTQAQFAAAADRRRRPLISLRRGRYLRLLLEINRVALLLLLLAYRSSHNHRDRLLGARERRRGIFLGGTRQVLAVDLLKNKTSIHDRAGE